MRLKGKVAIITGAASGIGAEITLEFARQGARVGVVDLDEKGAQATTDRIGSGDHPGEGLAIEADVSNNSQVEAMAEAVHGEWGRIDILVNCAGVAYAKSFLEHTEEMWDRTMDVDLKGQFLCAKAVAPHMIQQKGGRIINIGSIFGPNGVPMAVAYGAAKAGVHGFTRMLAMDLAPHGILVNAIAPGNIVTPLNDPLYELMSPSGDIEEGKQILAEKHYPLGRLGQVSDIAGGAVFLASNEASFITGQILFIDGGYSVP